MEDFWLVKALYSWFVLKSLYLPAKIRIGKKNKVIPVIDAYHMPNCRQTNVHESKHIYFFYISKLLY